VDWLHLILCSGEVLLAGRIPNSYFNLFMALSRACRMRFGPRRVTRAEIEEIDMEMKYFVSNYYAKIYRGTAERLPLCLSTIASLLDIVPLLWACGPAWTAWQFPMERKIGALGKLIRSASRPHENLERNVSQQIKADLVTSFDEQCLPAEWADATGQQVAAPGLPAGSLTVSDGSRTDCVLLPPRAAPTCLNMDELAKMRAVLQQGNAVEIPDEIKARKFFRAKLASGMIAGSKQVGSDSDTHRRRNYLVRINSSEKFFLPEGSVGELPVSTLVAARHYAVVFIDRRAMTFAYVERTQSTKDSIGRYGYAAVQFGIDCILGLGGVP